MSRKAWERLTAEQLKELYQKHSSGDIAEMFGIRREVVLKRIKRLNFLKRPSVNVVWRDTTFDQLKSLIASGLSYTQIGNLFGVTRSAVAGKIYWFKRKKNDA